MFDEESTCVIYHLRKRTKAFTHEINQNNLDINRLKTFAIESLQFFCFIRSMHRMIIIPRIPDDIQRENRLMEVIHPIMLVRELLTIGKSNELVHGFSFYLIDGQNGAPWLPPPHPPNSSYLPSDLAAAHGPFADPASSGLPSMASFRSSQAGIYASNEQTVQTGETLGKALQSV